MLLCCKTAVSMHKLTTIPEDTHPLVAIKTEFRTTEYKIIRHEPTFIPYCYQRQCSKPAPLHSHNYITGELTMQLKILTHALTTQSLPSIHYTIILYYKCDTYCSPRWKQLADVWPTICCSCSAIWAWNCCFNFLSSLPFFRELWKCWIPYNATAVGIWTILCRTAHSLLQLYTEFVSCKHHPHTLTHPIIITFKWVKIYRNWIPVPVHSLVWLTVTVFYTECYNAA